MERLLGRPVTPGTALGTAAVVRWIGGIAQLTPRILEEMALVARKGLAEPIEVVLVCEALSRALSLTIPGVRVVGIIAEQDDAPPEGAAVPTLVGVADVLSRIPDDVLVLLDCDRGLALVDPDGTTVAAYQAERERISPRRRMYIDFAHETARTLDGRAVRVTGVAISEEAVFAAAEGGADGIVLLPCACERAADEDDLGQLQTLTGLFRAAGGKPVTLIWDPETISAHALLRASLDADITVAVRLSPDTVGPDQAREYLREVGQELTGSETDWRPVQMAGVVRPEDGEPPEDREIQAHRLLVDLTGVWDVRDSSCLEWLGNWIAAASRVMAPVDVVLPAGVVEVVGDFVALGASGVGVPADEIGQIKAAIRETDAASLRATILER
jgi:hypothetical protein